MQVKQTGLPGLLLIEPRCFRDDRGFFLESFRAERYRDSGIFDAFVQDHHSRSRQGVLRGLHFQVKRPQAQIVTLSAAEFLTWRSTCALVQQRSAGGMASN
jgi:dTDP-4-dehydrorhamnose 3,5-epimerase